MEVLHATLRAVEAASRPDASQADLNHLGQLFDQLKSGEPREVAALASQLASETLPIEAQHLGLKLLQYLVMFRWQDFTQQEKHELATLCFNLFKSSGNSSIAWVIRSKSSLLMSLVTKRMGQPFWEQLLQELLPYASRGPLEAEKVCMVLRMLSEEVTWTGEGCSQSEAPDSRRALLSTLVETLDTALPYLHSCLEKHFVQAAQAATENEQQAAKAHTAAVRAALAALGEFGEWAPVKRLLNHRIIPACGFLTAQPDYRLEACAVLRRIGSRKQAQEEKEVFQAAMREAGEAFIQAAEWVLSPANGSELGFGGDLEEYAQFVCTAAGIWGVNHLQTLAEDRRNVFLHLMLQFSQNEYSQLVHRALPAWLGLLTAAEKARKGQPEGVSLPLECVAALIDVAGEKLRTGAHQVEESAEIPEWFDDFEDYVKSLVEYREMLSSIIRLSAALLPEHALEAATRRLQHAIQVCSTRGEVHEEQLISFEAMCYFVESVVGNVSQRYLPGGKRQPGMVVASDPGTVASIVDKLEGMFSLLLGLHFHHPVMVTYLARLLEAFSRLLALRKELAAPAIEKVFDMFNDLEMEGGPWHLPESPSVEWKERFQARSKIPGILVHYAKTAPESMRPHVEALAATTDEKWRANSISPGDRALLCDMMIASVCSADLSFQQGVVEHVLRGTQEEWRSPIWQTMLASPKALVAHFCPILATADGSLKVGGGFDRWMLCHHLQLLERAVKRLPASADNGAPEPDQQSSAAWHVLNPHLTWILPSLLQLILSLHQLSTPQGLELLGQAAAAMQMGARERAIYLRKLAEAKQAQDAGVKEEEEATLAGNNIAALRSWFRQIREALYQTIGYIVRNVGGFYGCLQLQAQFVSAMTDNLDHLHSSHIRMLIRHVFIPLAKFCPVSSRRTWLMPVLDRVFPHLHGRLTKGWERTLKDSGKLGATTANTREDDSAANEEIINDRLLRELTTEYLILLRTTQEKAEDNGVQHESVLELSWKEYPSAAMAACLTAASTLWWPDENIGKASNYLRSVVALAARNVLDEAGANLVRGTIQAVANGISACQGEVLSLTRDVLILQPPVRGTREVLRELPRVNAAVIESFNQQLLSTNSEKEQRAAIKTLLSNSGMEELAIALSDWRPQNQLSNMAEPKLRAPRLPSADEAGGLMGLAAANGL